MVLFWPLWSLYIMLYCLEDKWLIYTFIILTIPLPLVLAHVITLQFTLYLCEVDRFTSPLLTILLPFAHAVILQYTLYLSLLLVG